MYRRVYIDPYPGVSDNHQSNRSISSTLPPPPAPLHCHTKLAPQTDFGTNLESPSPDHFECQNQWNFVTAQKPCRVLNMYNCALKPYLRGTSEGYHTPCSWPQAELIASAQQNQSWSCQTGLAMSWFLFLRYSWSTIKLSLLMHSTYGSSINGACRGGGAGQADQATARPITRNQRTWVLT